MPPSTTITDRELQQHSQCSIYVPAEIDLLEEPARRTIRWALEERHRGRICLPPVLREHWVTEWKKCCNESVGPVYREGVGKAATFARRVYMFLLKYEVLHPYEPYVLQFDHGQVKGQNSLVVWHKYRKGDVPMLVDPILRRPRHVKTPNYTVLAQWLAAREKVDAAELGIAHLPMLYGLPWLTKDVNERLARQWLNRLVSEAADERGFPRTGPQCASCSQPCNEVFTGPEGKNWDTGL